MPPERTRTFVVLLALWLMVFAASSQTMIIAPILPRIGEELGVGEAMLGSLIAVYGVMAGVFALVAGPISDRIGRRPTLVITLLVWLFVLIHQNARRRAADGRYVGGFYTQEEIRELVRYAADRHITIVPEIEMVEAIRRERPKVVAIVHAETSTGVLQPVESIFAAETGSVATKKAPRMAPPLNM